MKFNEKLLSIRKKKGLSQEELGMELQFQGRQFPNGKQDNRTRIFKDW